MLSLADTRLGFAESIELADPENCEERLEHWDLALASFQTLDGKGKGDARVYGLLRSPAAEDDAT